MTDNTFSEQMIAIKMFIYWWQ